MVGFLFVLFQKGIIQKNLLTEHLGQGYFCGEPNQL